MSRIRVGAGAEDFDLQIDGPRGPRLLVSCLQRPSKMGVPGTLWSVDLSNDQATQIAMPRDIYPAGLELASVGGQTRLYFTNTPPEGHASIEVFDLSGDTLVWRDSLSTELLTTPNDLVVLPNGDLYVTDLVLSDSSIGRMITGVLKLRRGHVLRYDAASKTWSRFAKALSFPNGIATDGNRLYVNELAAKRILVFDLTTAEVIRRIELPGHPDNLRWEVRGRLLDVAMHRSWIDIGKHIAGKGHPSASFGCRVRVDAPDTPIEMLYDEREFHGGSTALVFNGRLFVSQVIGNEILVIERT